MAKKSFEFDTRYSDVEQELEERKSRIKTIRFKTCLKCGELKMLFKFTTDKRNSDGKMAICKSCRSKESLEYYYNNWEKLLIKHKEYRDTHQIDRSKYFETYQKNHKEHLQKLSKDWYKKNKKRIKKRNLKYYQENLEACKQIRKLWIEKNREGIKKYNRGYKRKHKTAS
ncbi:hypothetical protein ES705_17674 [subsurface metagenome]